MDNVERAKELFRKELDKRDYPYSDSAIDRIFDNWWAEKQELINLLRKNPNWDENKLMIHFDEDFDRDKDFDEIGKFFNWIYDMWITYYSDYYEDFNGNLKWYAILEGQSSVRRHLHTCCVEFSSVVEEVVPYMEEIEHIIPDFVWGRGQKLTRVVRRVAELLEWTKFRGFEREYAKFADAMNPLKITRHTCISVNPVDYLLMSNGNSWDSCHYIGNYPSDAGCYSGGAISYMLDPHTVIFYTVDGGYSGYNIECQPKIQRQVFAWGDGQLLQSRLYPQSNDNYSRQLYDDIRAIVQKTFADSLGKPNLWVKHDVRNVHTYNGALQYPDYECFRNLSNVSELKDDYDCAKESLYMGRPGICIQCGYQNYNKENILCSDCYEDDKIQCSRCGNYFDEDDTVCIDGEDYCENCTITCDWCGESEMRGYEHWVDEDIVCDHCFEHHAEYCEVCEEYSHVNGTVYINCTGIYVCNDCYDANYVTASPCGNACPIGDTILDEGTGEFICSCAADGTCCYGYTYEFEREESEDESEISA